MLFYRELTWEKFKHTLVLTVVDIGAIMFIISMSGIFGYGLAYEQMGDLFAEVMLGISDNPHVVLLMILGFLLVIGMFIESVVIILLFTSILLPMIDQVGVDPVHFGLVMMLMVTLGLVTPPVGVSTAVLPRTTIRGCSPGRTGRISPSFLSNTIEDAAVFSARSR
jgi:TRAP-type C4-dicarboxylate transport system permease large subunit